MADETLYVTTDSAGTGLRDAAPRFLTLDQLLDELGERVFIAEGDPPRVVRESVWDPEAAARFALDCAERAMGSMGDVPLTSGTTLADVVAAARRFLDEADAEGADIGRMKRISRLAHARRLRKMNEVVATAVTEIIEEDERVDLDALDDPTFASVAAVRDAVLAAVEALRHAALPHLTGSEEEDYEIATESSTTDRVTSVDTPWGNFLVGGKTGAASAALGAREAAERARQAATDEAGSSAVEAERAWQRERLAQALGS